VHEIKKITKSLKNTEAATRKLFIVTAINKITIKSPLVKGAIRGL
jgi:hypothetical protein